MVTGVASTVATTEQLDPYWIGLYQEGYISNFGYDSGGQYWISNSLISDQSQIRNYYPIQSDQDELHFQSFNLNTSQSSPAAFGNMDGVGSTLTTHNLQGRAGEIITISQDRENDLMILSYNENSQTFDSELISLPTIGVGTAAGNNEGIWMADLTEGGTGEDELITVQGAQIYGLKYNDESTPKLQIVYNITLPNGAPYRNIISSYEKQHLQFDVRYINGKNIIALIDANQNDIYVYEVTAGATPTLTEIGTFNEEISGTAYTAKIISITGTDITVVGSYDTFQDSDYFIFSDADDWTTVTSLELSGSQETAFEVYPMNIDEDGALELVLHEGTSYAVIDCADPLSCGVLVSHTSDSDFDNPPIAFDVTSASAGNEFCSLTGDYGTNVTLTCWASNGSQVYQKNMINVDTGLIVNVTSDDLSECYSQVYKSDDAFIDIGDYRVKRDILITPSFMAWVNPAGIYTSNAGLYGNNWHGGACQANGGFFPTWLDTNNYPDLLFQSNAGGPVKARLNTNVVAGINYPSIASVKVNSADSLNRACINTSYTFDVRFNQVPTNGYDIRINYNNTDWTIPYGNNTDLLADFIQIDVNSADSYLQTAGVKKVKIQARNSGNTSFETGVWTLNYQLYDEFYCEGGINNTNSTESAISPQILDLSKSPANPIGDNVNSAFGLEIFDFDGGAYELKMYPDIKTISNSVYTAVANSGTTWEVRPNNTYLISDTYSQEVFWVGFEIYVNESASADFSESVIPNQVITELLQISGEDILSGNWEYPDWFDSGRQYVRVMPVVVCGANATCWGYEINTAGNDKIDEGGSPVVTPPITVTDPDSRGNEAIGFFEGLGFSDKLSKILISFAIMMMSIFGVVTFFAMNPNVPSGALVFTIGIVMLLEIIGLTYMGMIPVGVLLALITISIGAIAFKFISGGD